MKKLLSIILCIALSVAPCFAHRAPYNKLQVKQHATMHEIVMVDRDKDGKIIGSGLCTAYAVGPHTLLTAEHCNDTKATTVYVDGNSIAIHDNQEHEYVINSRTLDHEDHMLLDLSGINFTNYLPLSDSVRLPRQGEHVYFWGCPAGVRDQYHEGVVSGTMPTATLGELGVDATGDTLYIVAVSVVGGDSGSSVYGEDGALIGIVTYGINGGQFAGMFPIQFTQAQINQSLQ